MSWSSRWQTKTPFGWWKLWWWLRLSVTSRHDFDVTVDCLITEDDMSLYFKEVEKGEGDTPEEELNEARYHDLLSVLLGAY